mgnify:FL=1
MVNALSRYLTDDRLKITYISILVMTIIAVAVGGVTVFTLHKAGMKSQENRLIEYVESQARMVEAILAFDARHSAQDHPLGAEGATIAQVIEAHESFKGFGETGEFSMAKRDGDQIIFVLRHRNFQIEKPKPVAFDSPTAEAMHEALSGRSGVITTLDYNGVPVLAAYEPVSGGHFGMVAKIDISEARAPIINAAILAAAVSVLLVTFGALTVVGINAPLLRRLHDSEVRQRSILDNIGDGIVTIDTDRKIQSFNKAAESIFGYSVNEITGRNVKVLLPQSDRDNQESFLERYLGLREGNFTGRTQEITAVKKDGTEISISFTLTQLQLEDTRMFAGVIRDITARKEIKNQLVANTVELSLANKDLERSNKELDDFAYIASHDLKEPLRGIHNYAQFLIEDYGDKLDEEGNSKLATLTRLTQRLEDLINSLLHFSRVGRVDLATKEVDLNANVMEIIDSLHVSLAENGIDLRIPRPLPSTHCDGARIGEVFRNLITNAMKYNDKEEKWIEVGFDDSPGDGRVFYVRDNGIGIREKHLGSIFRIFKRLHGRDKFGGGTGAGLTIVQKIVQRHGGRIWVESEHKIGTTFFFTLQGGE